MKTTQMKTDTEAGDRKEGSIFKFDDASIRLSFVRKVSHTLAPSCPLQPSTNQLVTISGVRPGVHSISHHLGFCRCIFTWGLQPKRRPIQVDHWAVSFLLGFILFLLLACSTTVWRSHPINLIFLAALSICQGWFIGMVSSTCLNISFPHRIESS